MDTGGIPRTPFADPYAFLPPGYEARARRDPARPGGESAVERAERAWGIKRQGEGEERDATGKTAGERAQIEELEAADRAVRAHEQAHMASAGALAVGGPSYSTVVGPDGRAYAVGGSVRIDTSPGGTPEETLAKAARIRAAALAPGDPSGQDLAVAAQAARMEAEARRRLDERRAAGGDETGDAAPAAASRAYRAAMAGDPAPPRIDRSG